jgi:hypothetical protein
MTAAIVVLLILGGADGLLYMISYNALVSAREQVADAWAVVEIELERRHLPSATGGPRPCPATSLHAVTGWSPRTISGPPPRPDRHACVRLGRSNHMFDVLTSLYPLK